LRDLGHVVGLSITDGGGGDECNVGNGWQRWLPTEGSEVKLDILKCKQYSEIGRTTVNLYLNDANSRRFTYSVRFALSTQEAATYSNWAFSRKDKKTSLQSTT